MNCGASACVASSNAGGSRTRCRRLGIAVAILLILATNVFAQEFDTGILPIVDSVHVAARTGDVEWIDSERLVTLATESDSLSSRVLLRFFDESGYPLGDQIIVDETTDEAVGTSVAWNGSELLAVWTRNSADGTSELWVRLFDADGNPLGDAQRASELPVNNILNSRAVVVDQETYWVVWLAPFRRSMAYKIQGRIVSHLTGPIGDEFTIQDSEDSALFGPFATVSDDGSVLITWGESLIPDLLWEAHINMRWFDSSAQPLSEISVIDRDMAHFATPETTSVIMEDDAFVAAWKSTYQWPPSDDVYYDLKWRKFDDEGMAMDETSWEPLSSTNALEGLDADAGIESGFAVLTWHDSREPTTDDDSKDDESMEAIERAETRYWSAAQKIDVNGALLEDSSLIVPSEICKAFFPRVDIGPQGRIAFVWTSARVGYRSRALLRLTDSLLLEFDSGEPCFGSSIMDDDDTDDDTDDDSGDDTDDDTDDDGDDDIAADSGDDDDDDDGCGC